MKTYEHHAPCHRTETDAAQKKPMAHVISLAVLTIVAWIMLIQEWRLGVPILLAAALIQLLRRCTLKFASLYCRSACQTEEDLQSFLQECLTGHKLILVSRAQKMQERLFAGRNQSCYEAQRKAWLFQWLTDHLWTLTLLFWLLLVCGDAWFLAGTDAFSLKIVLLFSLYYVLTVLAVRTLSETPYQKRRNS